MRLSNFRLSSTAIVTAVLFFDQLTKILITQNMSVGQVIPYTPWFNLVFRQNRGISFGLFPAYTWLAKFILIGFIIALTFWLSYQLWTAVKRLEAASYALILGGALGNLIDRFYHGSVVDFLEFHIHQYYWPAFNVADSCIVVGVVLIFAWQSWQSWGKSKANLET